MGFGIKNLLIRVHLEKKAKLILGPLLLKTLDLTNYSLKPQENALSQPTMDFLILSSHQSSTIILRFSLDRMMKEGIILCYCFLFMRFKKAMNHFGILCSRCGLMNEIYFTNGLKRNCWSVKMRIWLLKFTSNSCKLKKNMKNWSMFANFTLRLSKKNSSVSKYFRGYGRSSQVDVSVILGTWAHLFQYQIASIMKM